MLNHFPPPRPERPGASFACLERGRQIHARAAKSRRDAEENSGEQRNRDGESKNTQVDARRESQGTRLIAGHKRNDRVGSPVGEQNAQRATEHREHYAFRQKLTHNPRTARAQSQSHRHFLLPRSGPSEHQPATFAQAISRMIPTASIRTYKRIGVASARAGQAALRWDKSHFRIVGSRG